MENVLVFLGAMYLGDATAKAIDTYNKGGLLTDMLHPPSTAVGLELVYDVTHLSDTVKSVPKVCGYVVASYLVYKALGDDTP